MLLRPPLGIPGGDLHHFNTQFLIYTILEREQRNSLGLASLHHVTAVPRGRTMSLHRFCFYFLMESPDKLLEFFFFFFKGRKQDKH